MIQKSRFIQLVLIIIVSLSSCSYETSAEEPQKTQPNKPKTYKVQYQEKNTIEKLKSEINGSDSSNLDFEILEERKIKPRIVHKIHVFAITIEIEE